ncbi:hypothetical protein R70006_06230 [Paraburkholderia domus]|uniref:Lar family restriction alleviation protein n=1 Tax=Paraburkholderia domus TaxID=2793075 RepID=UPI00191301F3|nr:Lar family restriction alleviation protein [Paraburkholderia domus]MBK5052861.1 Lar family restriction alleviation protein [Burkholderia sp. R-70006]CAE6821661.1 hypothetical protein R70006_06230 [Paraburkholderia domus]
MPLESLEADALELNIARTRYLPDCPFCGRGALMHSSVNHGPTISKAPLYQSRISCMNHNCNASVLCNERTREAAQQGAIKHWVSRAAHCIEQAITVSELFYLQDSRSYVGNDVLWWAQKGHGGYTTDLRNARLFTREEAQAQHNARESDIPWPKEYIDARTRPAVDMQYINHTEALTGARPANSLLSASGA